MTTMMYKILRNAESPDPRIELLLIGADPKDGVAREIPTRKTTYFKFYYTIYN